MKTMIKYVLAFQLLIFISSSSYSQIVNGDFQTFDAGCSEDESLSCECVDHDNKDEELNSDSHFEDECSDYWFSTHGSPQVMTTGYGGTRWALMWSHYSGYYEDYIGEGICQMCFFDQHREYFLSMSIRNRDESGNTLDNAYIYLANGLATGGNGAGLLPNYTNREMVWNKISLAPSSNFNTESLSFSPEDDDYDWFWIYPQDDVTGTITRWFEVDNLVAGTCPTTETYNNTNSLPHATDRSSWVKTTSGGSGVDVLNNQEVHFHAGSYVLLGVDFHAQNGSTFHAMIDGCKSWSCTDPSQKWAGSEDSSNYNVNEYESVEPKPLEAPVATNLFDIYPNPNAGEFTIELNALEDISIFVMDVLGKVVYKNIITKAGINRLNVDISNHPKGIYLVKVIQGEEIITKRMVYQ